MVIAPTINIVNIALIIFSNSNIGVKSDLQPSSTYVTGFKFVATLNHPSNASIGTREEVKNRKGKNITKADCVA